MQTGNEIWSVYLLKKIHIKKFYTKHNLKNGSRSFLLLKNPLLKRISNISLFQKFQFLIEVAINFLLTQKGLELVSIPDFL